jgi:hypothetical protein
MNKSELTTQIGYRIRTSSRNFISDDEILVELNRSLDRLSGKIDLQKSQQEDTISFTGDGSYSQPSDFKKPISLYDRTNNFLYKRVSLDELRQIEDNGINAYAISGDDVYVESTASSATLTLSYYSTYDAKDSLDALQKGLSANADEPLLQERFHDYFVEDTAAVLFRKEGKYEDYQIANGEALRIYQNITEDNPTYKETVTETLGAYPYNYN